MTKLIFDKWEDGNTNPNRQMNLLQGTILTVTYKEVTNMANVVFNGKVTAVAPAPAFPSGVTVIVTITLPDSSVEDLSCVTDPDGNFTVSKSYPPGSYEAVANVAQFGNYQAKASSPVPFSVGLYDITVTLSAVVG